MACEISISKDGKKQVKLNDYDLYYELLFDWPMDTQWYIDCNLNALINKQSNPDAMYIEVWTYTKNATTHMGMHGYDFENCERKLWEKYQTYLQCQHEFVQKSSTDVDYTNTDGICIHCGMYQSQIFEADTVCPTCGKHEALIPLSTGTEVCTACYMKASWDEKDYARFYSPATMMDFFNSRERKLKSWSQKMDENNNMILTFYFKAWKESMMQIKCKKVDCGIWETIDFRIKNYDKVAKFEFGLWPCGNYFVENQEGFDLVIAKKEKQLFDYHPNAHNNIQILFNAGVCEFPKWKKKKRNFFRKETTNATSNNDK